MSVEYSVVSRTPVLATKDGLRPRCGGNDCRRLMHPGEHLSLVAHIRRSLAQPNAQDAHAYLCDRCVTRLGNRCRPAETSPTRRPLPALPGRPVEVW